MLTQEQAVEIRVLRRQGWTILKQSGLKLDLTAANAHIGPWLQSVANARVHGTTGEVPNVRLQLEREQLQPLPVSIVESSCSHCR